MRNIVFYHKDLDGCCAGAAIKLKIDNDAILYGLQHGMRFPMEIINDGDRVWIVDYSISTTEMDTLFNEVGTDGDIIWIDHHDSSSEAYANYKRYISGVRDNRPKEVRDSGCVLTWNFVLNDINDSLPEWVELVGDMDSWHWNFGDRTKHFVAGMESFPTEPNDPIWEDLYTGKITIEEVIKIGKTVDQVFVEKSKVSIKDLGFEATLDGYETIFVNARGGYNAYGDNIAEKFPFVCCYVHDGTNFRVSLYSSTMNVKNIAEKFGKRTRLGGGGHIGAAGFRCKRLPVKNVRPIDWSRLEL